MRFAMLMYPGPQAETELDPAGGNAELVKAMVAFNQRMVDAGVMLSGDGLKPTSKGARVRFGKAGKPIITDGPFTETKEILGGFWIIQAASLEEAVAWARQAPCPEGEMIEIRPIYEPEDFPSDIAKQEREQIEQMTRRRKN